MATWSGWSVRPTEVDVSSPQLSTKSTMVKINDFFDVVGPQDRKCRLCSKIVKVATIYNWGMKQHFMKHHRDEWATQIEPFIRKRNAPKKTKSLKSIAVGANVIDGDKFSGYECAVSGSEPKVKIQRSSNDDELEREYGTVEEFGTSETEGDHAAAVNENRGSLFSDNKLLPNDEFSLFAIFVAAEMRNMKTAEYRRKLKHAIQKCMLEMAAAEDDMLERNPSDKNMSFKGE